MMDNGTQNNAAAAGGGPDVLRSNKSIDIQLVFSHMLSIQQP
jgi:hypothetical protein